MTSRPVEYQWALDNAGRPVPIELAQRGAHYVCPRCRTTMIARRGEQLQHHFGHDVVTDCTQQNVARAVIRRWLAIKLGEALEAGQPVNLSWQCRYCGQTHTTDLLKAVNRVLEGQDIDAHFVDIALTGAAGERRAVLFVRDEEAPGAAALRTFMASTSFVIAVPASVLALRLAFTRWMEAAQVVDGPCPVWQQAAHIVREPEAILEALRKAVSRYPGYFCAPVETADGIAQVVRVGEQLLWLPPERWREIVGGSLSPLGKGVQVLIQNWAQKDGSTIGLYYVTMHEAHAIGVRHFGPGADPTPRLDGRFRQRKTTALDLARYLVTH